MEQTNWLLKKGNITPKNMTHGIHLNNSVRPNLHLLTPTTDCLTLILFMSSLYIAMYTFIKGALRFYTTFKILQSFKHSLNIARNMVWDDRVVKYRPTIMMGEPLLDSLAWLKAMALFEVLIDMGAPPMAQKKFAYQLFSLWVSCAGSCVPVLYFWTWNMFI